MVYFKGHTIIGEYMKRNIFLVLIVLFLSACATPTLVYKSNNYATNTKTFSTMEEPTFMQSNVQGEYDAYFPVANGYRLIYHHPGDYTVDTYSYYIALKNIYTYEEFSNFSASYNGRELPIAVIYSEGRDLLFRKKNNHYVNILLTKEDLIYAYENVGKLIIPLVVDGTTHNIVFPDYYLRKVLAKTTNIDKYKIAEQLANPPAPAPAPVPAQTPAQNYTQEKQNQPVAKPLRKPFEYSNNYSNLPDQLGDLTRVSFDYTQRYPCSINLHVVADLQEYSFENGYTDSYITSISVKENNVNENSCNKIDLKVYEVGPSLHITTAANESDKGLGDMVDLKRIKESIYIRNLRKSKI